MQDEKKIIQDEKEQIQKKLEKEQKKNSAARDEIRTLSEKLHQERRRRRIRVRKELREEKKKLENLKQSTSYKVGRAVTWVPRKVKRKVKNCREPKKDGIGPYGLLVLLSSEISVTI